MPNERSLTLNTQEGKRLLDGLQNDLRNISNEVKKKQPSLKEAAEAGIVKIRSASSKHQDLRLALLSESPELLEPFFMACDSKIPKVVQISLVGIQRLVSHEAVSPSAANNLINCLWNLMENEIEELKLLQTMTLLISTNGIVQGDALAKGLALCFRLHFTKNLTVNNAASATIRQLVSFVFERVQSEDSSECPKPVNDVNLEDLKNGSRNAPKSLGPAAADAFLLFQDLVQIVNADQPFWLNGLTEMTRTFGLELLENIFNNFASVFFRHKEFSFLLKEKVCPLVIKLFSPNIKYKPQHSNIRQSQPNYNNQTNNNLVFSDKPFFPISTRLLRIVNLLVQSFYTMLITECEIFLSLLIKFLEADKPGWQRALALEVLHKMCQQPKLLKSFCRFYDMKPSSSKIFRDIITALGVYCQSVFISPPLTPSLLSSLISAAASSSGTTPTSTGPNVNQATNNNGPMTPQPAFLFGNIWIPVLFTLQPGQTKSSFLDQLDKLEAPSVPDGYGLTTALYCLLDVVNSISSIFEWPNEPNVSCPNKDYQMKLNELDSETRALHESLLSSSWSGLVAAFSILLDTSTDESITEMILKSMEKLAAFYGIYNLSFPRECVIISMCKACLPVGYNLSILNFKIPTESQTPNSPIGSNSTLASAFGACHSRSSSLDLTTHSSSSNLNLLSSNASLLQQPPQSTSSGLYLRGSPQSESSDFRQQVVAVGNPLPSAQPGAQQGPVMLTAKNLQCMRAVLTVAYSYGFAMGDSWHTILSTLQHLAWILGLKPTTGGSMKAVKAGTEAGASTNSLITTAAMSDLPVLSALLSRLFESSHYAPLANLLSRVFNCSQKLDDFALKHLLDALCKLSEESMEIAYNNREPSLFAVAKLLETGLVNIHRYNIIWKQLSTHILQICQHPQIKMREWGAEALTCLVKNALSLDVDPKEKYIFLSPLQEMSYIQHADIRQKQLDCVLQILQVSGDTLAEGWPQILEIIGDINENQSENLIRIAFQCLQLIISDFLLILPPLCLFLLMDAITKFGSQTQELNVSLTAVSSLWNTADHMFQNRENIEKKLKNEHKETNSNNLPDYYRLWMSLFTKLGDLCTDSRPPLRKSASQTLFSTLTSHGEILDSSLWQSVLCQVLFPLLDRVWNLSNSASNDKITDVPKSIGISGIGVNGNTGSILLHHSRNTAQKQWSETQVLTLSGVAKIFSIKKEYLSTTSEDFEKSWTFLLQYISVAAKSKNSEVSISALKCFQDILSYPPVNNENEEGNTVIYLNGSNLSHNLWLTSWKVWLSIGMDCSKLSAEDCDNKFRSIYIPSQNFLTLLIRIFPYLFNFIKKSFTVDDFDQLANVFKRILSIPVDVATQTYLMSTNLQEQQIPVTPLQEAILFVMENIQNEIIYNSNIDNDSDTLLPSILNQYLIFSTYACTPPYFGKFQQNSNNKFISNSEWILASLVPFGERCLRSALSLYQITASRKSVIKANVLHSIIEALKIPLSMKYACPSQSTWKLALSSLLNVLNIGLPIARQNASDFANLWADLAMTLETFLFSASKPPLNQTLEDQQADEVLDVKVVETIRDSILPFSGQMPKEFVLQIVSILNKGSIHSATNGSPIDTDVTRKLREEFARCCFETLLQFSFLGPKGNPNLFIQSSLNTSPLNDIGLVNKLVVTSLLQRFHEVLIKYVEDEKLSGKCPLPRHRMAEISFVLQALATLASSMKKAPPETVEPGVWDQMISLYPHLVDCTISNCGQVNRALREVLHEYKDLLSPPSSQHKLLVNGKN